ncbi:MAG: LuxR C-terminal-related transcriptional regulator, partial [Halieaceae bacterium]|nr:LuxR C-terminal-related transcriptional regulator [Halieaceae bacterium]
PVTPDLEQRTRLLTRLDQRRHRPLTLISAPAGYGKTMLASMWLESCSCPSAWLSLDEADNDLHSFVSYLLAAVLSAFPTLELKTQSLLDAPTLASAPVLARYLLNDLAQIEERFILVLDDVHLIQEQVIYELLGELLHHSPPSLHLVLVGRYDPDLPIPSLRARSQVTEIRASDLRFTPEETAGLLRQMLQREVDDGVAAEWTQRTEGWVTALRLVALSLRHRDWSDDLAMNIEGDSRYLQEYLLAEVLAYLPVAKQAWLLKTSILERFCAPLIEAVCLQGSDDSLGLANVTGKVFISRLQRENLFVVPLDGRGEWFRFHHLFQQHLLTMLQEQMGGREIAALRLRASRWYAEKGLIEEALRYALAAGDVDAAVHLVEQERYGLMNREQWSRLGRWLRLLPEDAVAKSLPLMSARVYLAVYRGQDLEMVTVQQQAERLLAELSPESAEVQTTRAEFSVIQGLVDILVGQPTRAIATARKSLEVLPPQALHIRSLAIATTAGGLQMQGELGHGIALIEKALADPSWPAGLHTKMAHYLCVACFQEGDLGGVLRFAREYLPIAEQLDAAESLSFVRYHLGSTHYLRNELAQAESYLLALWQDRATSAPTYLAMGIFALALIYLSQDRLVEAEQAIDRLSAQLRETVYTFALASTEAFRVELALRTGDLAGARRLSQGVEFDLRPPIWFFYVPQLTAIKLLLAEGSDHSLDEARTRLDALDEQMRGIHRNNVRIDVLALLALVNNALGDEPAAMEKLGAALTLGQPGGFIRTFVDLGAPMAGLLVRLKEQQTGRGLAAYIDQILAAFPAEGPATTRQDLQPATTPAENPLTRRERQVIRLLATDLSPEEIADKLVTSPHTLNTHIKNIYRKLDVHKREEAIRRVREMDLLR